MGKSSERRRAAAQQGHESFHRDLVAFHQREVDKYAAKAAELRAAGKTKAAARMDKVVARNVTKVAEHQQKLDAGLN